MTSTETDKNRQNFPSFIIEDYVGRKWTKADEFSEFYDQMLSQRKENMTKCSQKNGRRIPNYMACGFGRKAKK